MAPPSPFVCLTFCVPDLCVPASLQHWYEAVGSGMVNPFLHTYSEYALDKPLIIGEFSQCCSGPLELDEAHGRSERHASQDASQREHVPAAAAVAAEATAMTTTMAMEAFSSFFLLFLSFFFFNFFL